MTNNKGFKIWSRFRLMHLLVYRSILIWIHMYILLQIDRRFAFGLSDDIIFLVLDRNDVKPYQHRFLPNASEQVAIATNAWLRNQSGFDLTWGISKPLFRIEWRNWGYIRVHYVFKWTKIELFGMGLLQSFDCRRYFTINKYD